MLPLGAAGALVDVEPPLKPLIPLGNPARRDRRSSHGRSSHGEKERIMGVRGQLGVGIE